MYSCLLHRHTLHCSGTVNWHNRPHLPNNLTVILNMCCLSSKPRLLFKQKSKYIMLTCLHVLQLSYFLRLQCIVAVNLSHNTLLYKVKSHNSEHNTHTHNCCGRDSNPKHTFDIRIRCITYHCIF